MKYEVVVGNIGTVHLGNNRREALRIFREYRDMSLTGMGRAGLESVWVYEDTEPMEEFDTSEANRILSSDGKQFGFLTGAARRCGLEGCTGRQLQVRWCPDGRQTWPCAKGLVEHGGQLYIGPIDESVLKCPAA